jgi:hypothetical protein
MLRIFDFGREALKIIAIITMTMDHIGIILHPNVFLLRVVGRLAFPLFAYLIALGIESTKRPGKYLLTLVSFALISQIPYSLAFEIQLIERLNIIFPLFLSALTLYALKRGKTQTFLIGLIFSILISIALNMEGTFYVILIVACMKLVIKKPEIGVLALVGVNLLLFPDIQLFSLLAVPLILMHMINPLKIETVISERSVYYLLQKYFFYLFYPLHLVLLYSINA